MRNLEASPGEGVVLPPEPEGKSHPGAGDGLGARERASPGAGEKASPEEASPGAGEGASSGAERGGVASTGSVKARGKASPEIGVGSLSLLLI